MSRSCSNLVERSCRVHRPRVTNPSVIGHAQQSGFTLGEIRELFFGFDVGVPPSVRWEALARRKLADLEAQLARIHAMQNLLHEGIRCGCLTIEQCTVWLSGLEPAV